MVLKKTLYRSMHICMLLNFIVLVVTGMMRFLLPFSIEVTRLHMLSGFAITALIGFHIFGRLKAMKNIIKPPKKANRHWTVHIPLLGSTLLCCVFWSAAWYNWPGAKHTVALSYESRHQAEILRTSHKIATQSNQHGIHLFKLATEGASIELDLEWTKLAQDPKKTLAVAIWAETKSGSIIETLYLSEPLRFTENPKWQGKKVRRGEILPVWRNRYTAISGVSADGQTEVNSGPTKNHKYDLDNNFSGDVDFVVYVEINAANDDSPSRLYSAYIEPESNKYGFLRLTGTGEGAYKSGEINYELDKVKLSPLIERILVKTDWGK